MRQTDERNTDHRTVG